VRDKVLMAFDQQADMVLIDLQPEADIDRTVRIGRSLLANYDAQDGLVSIEVLSIKALRRPSVIDALHQLLGGSGMQFYGLALPWTDRQVPAPPITRATVRVVTAPQPRSAAAQPQRLLRNDGPDQPAAPVTGGTVTKVRQLVSA
jgi:hypothetical protein